jgi:hypothetical protein
LFTGGRREKYVSAADQKITVVALSTLRTDKTKAAPMLNMISIHTYGFLR